MKNLKEQFDALSENEKKDFIQSLIPEFAKYMCGEEQNTPAGMDIRMAMMSKCGMGSMFNQDTNCC